MTNTTVLNKAADNIRILAASMVDIAKSGHPGSGEVLHRDIPKSM